MPRQLAYPNRDEFDAVIHLVSEEARAYLAGLDERPARAQNIQEALNAFDEALPEVGAGAAAALTQLIRKGMEATTTTAGPRSFHFVVGGTTPAALGADWWTTTLDQMAYAWVASPLAVRLEQISLRWLQELFGLPQTWQGIMTTGATMANFVGLAAARQWAGEQLGVDVAEQGMSRLGEIPVYASGISHPSDVKALSMLGMGRASIQRMAGDNLGRFDLAALEHALQRRKGKPAIVIAVAGEPNAGLFDPIGRLADLAAEHNAWLHVDGAFGLFARLSEESAYLVEGVERAQSVAVDGHKWLNVPYDCGFAFVHDIRLMGAAFGHSAAYLPQASDPEPVLGALAPEMSRRGRALTVWATLKAYGRQGIQRMVQESIDLAQYLCSLISDLPDLELLAEAPLNVVCFRFNPGGRSEEELNQINHALGDALLADGRVFVGTTTLDGRVGLRPAIVNWRTRREDINLLVFAARQVGERIDRQRRR